MNPPNEAKLLPCPICHEGVTYTLRTQTSPWNYSCGVCGQYIGTFTPTKKYCVNPDDCEYSDCPTAFCDRNTRTPSHPQSTEEICAKVREDANSWTPEYRAFLFKKGMEIVDSQPSDPTWVKDAAEEIDTTKRGELERVVNGALRDSIHAHGPITLETINSASKRVFKSIKNWNKQILTRHAKGKV